MTEIDAAALYCAAERVGRDHTAAMDPDPASAPNPPQRLAAARLNRLLTAINDRARRAFHPPAPERPAEADPQPWEPPKKERDFWDGD